MIMQQPMQLLRMVACGWQPALGTRTYQSSARVLMPDTRDVPDAPEAPKRSEEVKRANQESEEIVGQRMQPVLGADDGKAGMQPQGIPMATGAGSHVTAATMAATSPVNKQFAEQQYNTSSGVLGYLNRPAPGASRKLSSLAMGRTTPICMACGVAPCHCTAHARRYASKTPSDEQREHVAGPNVVQPAYDKLGDKASAPGRVGPAEAALDPMAGPSSGYGGAGGPAQTREGEGGSTTANSQAPEQPRLQPGPAAVGGAEASAVGPSPDGYTPGSTSTSSMRREGGKLSEDEMTEGDRRKQADVAEASDTGTLKARSEDQNSPITPEGNLRGRTFPKEPTDKPPVEPSETPASSSFPA